MFIRRSGRHSERHRPIFALHHRENTLQELSGLKPKLTDTDKVRCRSHRPRLRVVVILSTVVFLALLCFTPPMGLEHSETTEGSADVGDTRNQKSQPSPDERELKRLLSTNSEQACRRASRTSSFGGVQVQVTLGCDGAPRSWTVVREKENGASIH